MIYKSDERILTREKMVQDKQLESEVFQHATNTLHVQLQLHLCFVLID